jgi:hypothetical protein
MKGKQHLDRAILLSTNEAITLAHYADRIEPADQQEPPALVCPICREALQLTRMHDRQRTRAFQHAAGDHANCPLVNVHFSSAAFASAHAFSLTLEQQRRERFLAQWPLYLSEIRRHVEGYSIDRFATTISHADVLHIWSCPTLADTDIVYVFLALSAFVAETPGASPPTWLRFLFDATVLDAADLHPPNAAPPRFFRLRYRCAHRAMFPNANQLLDWDEVTVSDVFLHRRVVVPGAEREAFAQRMAAHPSVLEDEGPSIAMPYRHDLFRDGG